MKPIHFRGVNYDPQLVSKVAGQGYRVKVATGNIITVAAATQFEVKVAYMVDGKYHLLTGSLDLKQPEQEIYVINKFVLKKCAEQQSSFTDRQFEQQRENVQQQRRGFGQYRW